MNGHNNPVQVGGAHESYLRTFQGVSPLEQQTTKMAEGQDPGRTPAKGGFIIISAFGMRVRKSVIGAFSTFYCVFCEI